MNIFYEQEKEFPNGLYKRENTYEQGGSYVNSQIYKTSPQGHMLEVAQLKRAIKLNTISPFLANQKAQEHTISRISISNLNVVDESQHKSSEKFLSPSQLLQNDLENVIPINGTSIIVARVLLDGCFDI